MHENSQTGKQLATRSVVQLGVWTLLWLATLALARFGPEFLWHSRPVASWIAVIANLVVGVGLIVAHVRYLRAVDDLHRKILLDAVALALGVGLVGGLAYAVATSAHLIAWHDNIAFLTLLMSAVYAVAAVLGNLRYR